MSFVLAEPEPAVRPASGGGKIILITGIMAAGKTTVAQRLAERFPASVHLRGDAFRRMVVNGGVELTPQPSPAALEQLRLRYRLAVDSAETYAAAGFTVVYQDVILGPELANVVRLFAGLRLYVVVLCPSAEVVARREAGRTKTGYGAWSVAELDHTLRSETPRLGLWLDSSHMGVDETVDALLSGLDRAAVDPADW